MIRHRDCLVAVSFFIYLLLDEQDLPLSSSVDGDSFLLLHVQACTPGYLFSLYLLHLVGPYLLLTAGRCCCCMVLTALPATLLAVHVSI